MKIYPQALTFLITPQIWCCFADDGKEIAKLKRCTCRACKALAHLIRKFVTFSLPLTLSLGSLSTRVFETPTATGSELFSLLTCFHATTFTLLSIFSPLEMINTKIWETPVSWHAKFSLPVAVRVSKTPVLKLPFVKAPYSFKAWPNARNISTQHLATLLGTTCCVRLATLLRYVARVRPVHSTHVATSCNNVALKCCERLARP